MTVLQQLSNLDVNRITLEEALELRALGSLVRGEFERALVPVPEAMSEALRTLSKDIDERRRDSLEKRLKDISSQEAGLLSAAEKRERLAKEREAIEAQLKPSGVPQPV